MSVSWILKLLLKPPLPRLCQCRLILRQLPLPLGKLLHQHLSNNRLSHSQLHRPRKQLPNRHRFRLQQLPCRVLLTILLRQFKQHQLPRPVS